ncbi:hypothetical protein BRC76_00725 [Halobacteriales archaeon QH_8_67_36]|nr:MAG: hypothetical protein BRC76_00725 [Halobacteriales archaeon QH_8_67_36]
MAAMRSVPSACPAVASGAGAVSAAVASRWADSATNWSCRRLRYRHLLDVEQRPDPHPVVARVGDGDAG